MYLPVLEFLDVRKKCAWLLAKYVVPKDTTIKICDNRRLVVTASFAFYVITFEPIEVQMTF